jgi:alkanesulfonate monooxygenase SsuD/methylene tetrahydromethanopterin reductase-like flavin-dependent oxidoreductase (luciferase family)
VSSTARYEEEQHVKSMEAPKVGVWTDARPEPAGHWDGGRYAELREEARLADQLGFHSICTTEIHGVDEGYMPTQLPLIAGLSDATERIRFMTNTLLLPLHPWDQVVEQALVADLLSDGRLSLGVAAGRYAPEYDLAGVDFRRRGALMEDGLRFLRQSLGDEDGPGEGHIPVYVGGSTVHALDRAVRLADGAVPVDFFDADTAFADLWETRLAPALSAHDRTLDDFRFTICVPLWASDDPERDWFLFYEQAIAYQFGQLEPDPWWTRERMLVDTPEDIARRLREIRSRAPYHEIVFWYRIPGIGHERALEHLDLVAQRVLPLLAA